MKGQFLAICLISFFFFLLICFTTQCVIHEILTMDLAYQVSGQLRTAITVNSLRPRQNGHLFADDTFKRIFLNKNIRISIKISLKFVPDGPINNIPTLVQVMAWRRPGDNPLSEPMMVILPTHICVTRPQWVNNVLYAKLCYIGNVIQKKSKCAMCANDLMTQGIKLVMHCWFGSEYKDLYWIQTWRPRQNIQNFERDVFKIIFFSKNVFHLKCLIRKVRTGDNKSTLAQLRAWCQTGSMPFYETIMT